MKSSAAGLRPVRAAVFGLFAMAGVWGVATASSAQNWNTDAPKGRKTASGDIIVNLPEAPRYVLDGINGSHLGDTLPIKKVVYGPRDGRMAFDVEFDRADGPNPRLRFFGEHEVAITLPPQDTPG